MTHTSPITAADSAHIATFRTWLSTQEQTDARELGMRLDMGLDGDLLEMEREGWVMLSNWLYVFAADVHKDRVRYKAFDPLIRLADAVCASLPRVVAVATPDPVAPLGAVVGQGTLF